MEPQKCEAFQATHCNSERQNIFIPYKKAMNIKNRGEAAAANRQRHEPPPQTWDEWLGWHQIEECIL